jgi:cytochrome c oxidase subunit 4
VDATPTAHESHEDAVTGGHVVDARILLGVWGALLVLTVLTVAATKVDLGSGNLWLALGIAAVKATLVAMYFMHLRYDHPINAIVFAGAMVFLAIFLGIVILDSLQYEPELIPGYAPGLDR